MQQRQDDELLTRDELAAHLRVSTKWLLEMIRQGEAPRPIRLGRAIRWRWGTIRRWVLAVETLQELGINLSVLGKSPADLGNSGEVPPEPSGAGKKRG